MRRPYRVDSAKIVDQVERQLEAFNAVEKPFLSVVPLEQLTYEGAKEKSRDSVRTEHDLSEEADVSLTPPPPDCPSGPTPEPAQLPEEKATPPETPQKTPPEVTPETPTSEDTRISEDSPTPRIPKETKPKVREILF